MENNRAGRLRSYFAHKSGNINFYYCKKQVRLKKLTFCSSHFFIFYLASFRSSLFKKKVNLIFEIRSQDILNFNIKIIATLLIVLEIVLRLVVQDIQNVRCKFDREKYVTRILVKNRGEEKGVFGPPAKGRWSCFYRSARAANKKLNNINSLNVFS